MTHDLVLCHVISIFEWMKKRMNQLVNEWDFDSESSQLESESESSLRFQESNSLAYYYALRVDRVEALLPESTSGISPLPASHKYSFITRASKTGKKLPTENKWKWYIYIYIKLL